MALLMYSLTEVTGQRSTEYRTQVVFGTEVRSRTARALLLAGPVGAIVTLVLYPFLKVAGLGIGIAVAAGIVMLLTHRTNTGMKLPLYKAALDRSRTTLGKLMICGETVDLERQSKIAVIVPSSIPVSDDPENQPVPISQIEEALGIFDHHEDPTKPKTRRARREQKNHAEEVKNQLDEIISA